MPTITPHAHARARLARALLSMDGLSLGDSFCAQFFIPEVWNHHFDSRTVPPGPWGYTDDTEMALAIVEVLAEHDRIDQYQLAANFARRYVANIHRGYGPAAHGILQAIHDGTPWRNVSYAAFNGTGSMGNGGAMRVAPVGAYFADDLDRVVHEADASAEITHAHPEGRAGALAVAVATATVWRHTATGSATRGCLMRAAMEHISDGRTREGIEAALELPPDTPVERAARILGNGSRVTAPDTVPLALWLAERSLDDLPEALWSVVQAGGDIDTIGAIVGGMVACYAPSTIPQAWLKAREPLQTDVRLPGVRWPQ